VSDLHALLAATASGTKEALVFPRRASIYRQGERANCLFYLRQGIVKLTAASPSGREGVVAVLGPGELFGEGALLHRRVRTASAICMARSEVVRISRESVLAATRRSPEVAETVLRHILRRTAQYEDALLHQLLNNSERRLAHILLKLSGHNGDARNEGARKPGIIQHVSQSTLAEMVGTTRPRINGFMNKFRRLGHIDYDESRVRVRPSLQQILMEESAPQPAPRRVPR